MRWNAFGTGAPRVGYGRHPAARPAETSRPVDVVPRKISARADAGNISGDPANPVRRFGVLGGPADVGIGGHGDRMVGQRVFRLESGAFRRPMGPSVCSLFMKGDDTVWEALNWLKGMLSAAPSAIESGLTPVPLSSANS